MKKIIVNCLVGVILISASPFAHSVQETIESLPDTSGLIGTALVTSGYTGSFRTEYRGARAFANINPSGARWQAKCDSSQLSCASSKVYGEKRDLNSELSLRLPTIELIPLYIKYRDGTPASDVEIRLTNNINFRCAPSFFTSCSWNAAVYSPIVKQSSTESIQAYFTDSVGMITLVFVKERVWGTSAQDGFTIELVRSGGGSGNISKYDFTQAKPNDLVVLEIDSPSVESSKKAAAEAQLNARKCTAQISGNQVTQIPACPAFAPLPSGQSILVANDPLTYREKTPNSVIALQGLIEKDITSVDVLTNDFCNSPKVLTGFKWVDKSKVYLSVTTGSEGMCRLKVTTNLGIVYEVQMPVSSWSVSVMRPPTITGNGLSNRGILQVGNSFQLSNLNFNYSGSTFKVGLVAPLYFGVKNENACNVDENLLVLAKSSGQCVITIGWPEFAFGSRVYSSGSSEFALFTVKSNAELAQDAEKLKYERQESVEKARQAAEKAKQDAKLCKPSDQSRLRNAYSPVTASINRTEALRGKLDRVNYLISQVGKNGPIQLPPSEYSDLLAGYPVLANSRQVPIYVYQAILQGALIGENKNYQSALTKANLAYSKASAGCKKVVGKP